MTHPDFMAQIDAYLDDELAPSDAQALKVHLARCTDCDRFRRDRLALRTAIQGHLPALEAPRTLRDGVRNALRAGSPARAPGRFRARASWWPLAYAASLAAVALVSWHLALQRATDETVAQEVLASHVRSLMPGHLTDVLSSDQHTVKPWFNGRLDFSPPVYDFSGRGYPLLGGRLDYIAGRPVAALTYGRRQHLINVYVWPIGGAWSGGPPMMERQGYHLLHWATAENVYWVVSDLGLAELRDFAAFLTQADSAAGGFR